MIHETEKSISSFDQKQTLKQFSSSTDRNYNTDHLQSLLKDTNIKIKRAVNSLRWVTGEDMSLELRPRHVTHLELLDNISVHYKIPVSGEKGACIVKFSYLSEGEIQAYMSLTKKEPDEGNCDKKKEGRFSTIEIKGGENDRFL
jgi:hypothetical protein